MKKLFQTILIALGCLHLLGGPHSVLQVCAWIGMLVTYSQEGGIVQAANDTFSGERPCALCLKLEEIEKSERDELPLPSRGVAQGGVMQDLIPPRVVDLRRPSAVDVPSPPLPEVILRMGARQLAPPTPPPRFVVA